MRRHLPVTAVDLGIVKRRFVNAALQIVRVLCPERLCALSGVSFCD
jgi:hypothetical protein